MDLLLRVAASRGCPQGALPRTWPVLGVHRAVAASPPAGPPPLARPALGAHARSCRRELRLASGLSAPRQGLPKHRGGVLRPVPRAPGLQLHRRGAEKVSNGVDPTVTHLEQGLQVSLRSRSCGRVAAEAARGPAVHGTRRQGGLGTLLKPDPGHD